MQVPVCTFLLDSTVCDGLVIGLPVVRVQILAFRPLVQRGPNSPLWSTD
jgi:hypothetical protein